jgi:hypothetical protein
MQVRKHIQTILGLASVSALSVAGLMIPVSAQDTSVVTLDITAGALTMYAADDTDNNDLCANGDSGSEDANADDGSLTSVDCSAAERQISLTGLSVGANRQSATGTFNDILFEDLSGSQNNTYAVSATFGDFVNGSGGSDIVLGTDPDGAGSNLGCTINPAAGSLDGILPTNLESDAGFANLDAGAQTTVTDTSTAVDIFDTSSLDVLPGRYDLDGATYACDVPAFVEAGSYTQDVVFTVAAS